MARCRFGKPRALSDCSIWLLLPSWQAITLVRLIISRSTSHFAAPTGSYEKGRLVNLSQNTWTFIPGVAYTKIIPQANIELTGIWDMEFDTEDRATHYQNGILSDLEVLAIKRFKNGLGIGFVESWIQQVNDDGGAPAVLNGFVGRAFGVGPIVTYSTKLGKSHLDFNARWIHDFDVRNRVAGDGFNFTASLKF